MTARTKETTHDPKGPLAAWEWSAYADRTSRGNTPAARAYTNDRREGVTNPDLVEIIEADDPRHRSNQGQRTTLNRAERRARGRVNGKAISHSPRHVKATTHPLNSLVLAAKRNAEQLAEAKAAHPAHAPATTELTERTAA